MSKVIPFCLCIALFLSYCLIALVAAEETDLYKLLGVARSATTQEIKKAYRKKALDTHPDKNKDVPAEEAAAAFQKVVHAFETLSDASSRKRYDRTGRSGDPEHGGGGGHQQGGFRRNFQWNTNNFHQRQRRPKQKLKDRFEVKKAQSRILHIVSLEQLEVIIATSNRGEDPVLERNVLICFYTPPHETHVMDEMVYPWPFAAMSSQGIWWEDMLQTTVVRYHRSNSLTEFFGVPKGEDLDKPLFLFGKRGQKFGDLGSWVRLSTDKREVFDKWVWQCLEVQITFVNNHDHPVEMFWVHERRATLQGTIAPNETFQRTTKLSHEWWVRDSRVDTFSDSPGRTYMTENTCLYSVKITDDTRTQYTIPKRNCFDLSGHCKYWNRFRNECTRNSSFMHKYCAATCGTCRKESIHDDPMQYDTPQENNREEETSSSAKDEL